MTRISTNAAQHSALADIMRAQRELNLAQRQYATGKLASDLKGFGSQAEMLTATRAVTAREAAYEEAGKRLQARLDVQALAIGEVSTVASELRQSLTDALGLDDGRTLLARLEDLAGRASSALNTQFAGTYLFGGGRDNVAPFDAKALADFAGGSPTGALFRDGDIRAVAKLDDGAPMETGITARELGFDLMDSLNRIRDFADANGGSFSDPLTAAERAFLTAEIANASAAFDSITIVEARNGLAQNQVETATERAGARRMALEGLTSDMEDADMAEVTVRIQQAQLALQASAQAFAMLSRTSLLDFLQ